MQTHADCPQSWWEFSFEAAVHIYNRTPIRRTNWTTPFENIFNKQPDIQYFKTFGCLAWVYKPKEICKNKLDNRSEPMTFIGYEIGSKAYKFMQKDNSIFIATHAWFDEEKFPRAKNENGSSQNKLKICPPDINKDQKDTDSSTDPNIDKDYNHDDNSSDDTPNDKQESSKSEEERFESAEEEDEVEDNLKPKSSDDEKSSTGHSRRSSIHSSNEKSKEGSNHGDEPDQRSENDPDNPFEESEPEIPEIFTRSGAGPSMLRRSSRVPKPVIKYGSAYGDKPAIQIEKEIRSDKAWQKAVEPKANVITKQAHNTFHNDLETLIKEGGNKSIHYLLAQAVDIEKNPRELQYRNIL
jgi:hypothetical protein